MIQIAMASACLRRCEEDCNNGHPHPLLCKFFCPPYCATHLERPDPEGTIAELQRRNSTDSVVPNCNGEELELSLGSWHLLAWCTNGERRSLKLLRHYLAAMNGALRDAKRRIHTHLSASSFAHPGAQPTLISKNILAIKINCVNQPAIHVKANKYTETLSKLQ
ncbi:hypothetical protein GH714_024284 [Hevea brasiliensis]|uniref:Uncharacterized protein n=1 Tax=Hevea brasiliensis TaxID=3981 RepID=A0A6A6LAY2_HEVBR|nr:hypothetical protein GH714_023917 [Hevea brasiliensis]KAF2298600.1 hypothetical protein GH714_024284 [Hevea brasiliensis]